MKYLATTALLTFSLAQMAMAADYRYEVQPGDSLSVIAYNAYGDASRWVSIYELNRDVVGDGGNVVFVGEQLIIADAREGLVEQSTGFTALDDDEIGTATQAAVATETTDEASAATEESVTETSSAGDEEETVAALPETATGPADVTLFDLPGSIEILTGNEYAPFTDEGLPEGGMLTEVVLAAFGGMNETPEVEFINWSSGYRLAKRGRAHGTFPWFYNEERNQSFHFSDPLYDVLIQVFHRVDTGIEFTKKEDLIGLRVCRPAGYFTHDIQDLIDQNLIEYQTPKSVEECFQRVFDEEADVASVNELTGGSIIIQNGWEKDLQAAEQALAVQSLHMIFPRNVKQSEDILNRFNDSLTAMADTGQLNDIISRHIQAYYDAL